MGSVVYNGSVVNSAVSKINSLQNNFSSLSSGIKSATNQIVSARGFNEYIGGINSDTFSSAVAECGNYVSELVNFVRQKQITILAYSENQGDINAFLDTLSNSDYKQLDLSEIDKYISFGKKAGNFFKGIGSDIATVGLGLTEGVLDFGETAADFVTIGGTLFSSAFTKGYDFITGKDTTTAMWEQTKAVVSEKKVESLFNNFYSNTEIGQDIKNNAYKFDGVRGISKGLGYTAGLIGTNILTGGLASGLGVGAAGSITAGQLATSAGLMGFSNGTEEAWADGATIGKGLAYGAASGAWEGAQWYLGAKINQYGGLGDRVASGIFKGATSGVGTRIAMDTVDSGLEGFVQPALTMIYKDYGGSTFQENYAKAFAAAGGWGNVLSQAAMGGFASAIGEFSGARKLLKESGGTVPDADSRALAETSTLAGEGAGADQIFKEADIDNAHALADRKMPLADAGGDGNWDSVFKETDSVDSRVLADSAEPGTLKGSGIMEAYGDAGVEDARRVFASNTDGIYTKQGETLLIPENVPSPTKVMPGETLADRLKKSQYSNQKAIPSKVLQENNIKLNSGDKILYSASSDKYFRVGADGYVTQLPNELFTYDGLRNADLRLVRDDVHGVWRDQITGMEAPISPKSKWTELKDHIIDGQKKQGNPTGLHESQSLVTQVESGKIFVYYDGVKYTNKSGVEFVSKPGNVSLVEVSGARINPSDGSLILTKTDSSTVVIPVNKDGLLNVGWGYSSKVSGMKESTFFPHTWSQSDIQNYVNNFLMDSNTRPDHFATMTDKNHRTSYSATYHPVYVDPNTKKSFVVEVQVRYGELRDGTVRSIKNAQIESIYPINSEAIRDVLPNTYR